MYFSPLSYLDVMVRSLVMSDAHAMNPSSISMRKQFLEIFIPCGFIKLRSNPKIEQRGVSFAPRFVYGMNVLYLVE